MQIGKPKFIFEAKGIQRMELLVLSHLNWKMQSITPCSFVDYFLRKMTNDPYPTDSSMLRSLELILSITKCIHFTEKFCFLNYDQWGAYWEINAGIDLLEFKPSEIAAAVAIFVSKDLQESDINHTLTRFAIVDKVRGGSNCGSTKFLLLVFHLENLSSTDILNWRHLCLISDTGMILSYVVTLCLLMSMLERINI